MNQFEPKTAGGYEWEEFARRGGFIYGRIGLGAACWRESTGEYCHEADAKVRERASLVPVRKLRVEDVPLGVPCRIRDSARPLGVVAEFTPHWYNGKYFVGNLEGWAATFSVDQIDPDSIVRPSPLTGSRSPGEVVLNAIDRILREAKINDPDPVLGELDVGSVSTFGLVEGLIRERDTLRRTRADTLKEASQICRHLTRTGPVFKAEDTFRHGAEACERALVFQAGQV